MSYRQYYKNRGRGGVLPRLGLPVHTDGYNRGRGRAGFGGGYQGGQRGGQRGRGGADRARGLYYRAQQVRQRIPGRPQKPWFKITVIRGAEYGKDFVLRALNNFLDRPLWPVLWKELDDGNATFLVDDRDVSDTIETASRRLQGPNGQKMNIRVAPFAAPYVPLESDEVDLLKGVLANRYDAMTGHLNLSAFSLDPAFGKEANYSLQRNNVIMTVVDLISRERPAAENIRSIDVSQNRLRFMDYFASFVPRLPNVTRLILHHNQIEHLNELEKLSGWKLTELDLDQTPLCSRYRENTAYINDIRGIFRKLTRLDGTDLPPQTRFPLDEDEAVVASSSMPPIKSSFFVDENVKNLTLKFLELYFSIFDDEDKQKRQSLLEAYDDDATFTMCATNLSSDAHFKRGDNWQELVRDSHNILKMEVWERFRNKLVHRGKLAILSHLCNTFPPTSHIASSFLIDISFASGNVLCVNASGVFRDRSGGDTAQDPPPLRHFNRVFLLVQNEKGLCIANELLFVSTFTSDQFAMYSNMVEKASSTVEQIPMHPMAVIPPSIAGPSNVIPEISKGNLLEQFVRESGMKVDWAKKCLEDYEYDYAKAAAAFSQLKQSGAIPPDAFQ